MNFSQSQTARSFSDSCFSSVSGSMLSSFLRPCFTSDSYVDPKIQTSLPKNVALLRQSYVSFSQNTLAGQPLSPADLFPFMFHQYMPWVVFFNYNIDFQRLVEALHTVAQKYLLLCGRLSTDATGRYVIEVNASVLRHSVKSFVKVGSTKEKKYDFSS